MPHADIAKLILLAITGVRELTEIIETLSEDFDKEDLGLDDASERTQAKIDRIRTKIASVRRLSGELDVAATIQGEG